MTDWMKNGTVSRFRTGDEKENRRENKRKKKISLEEKI